MPWPRVRRRRLLPRLALAGGVAGASLLAVEFALRLPLSAGIWLAGPPNTQLVFQPDPLVMPGVSGPARVILSSLGLRGDEPTAGRSPRVLCLGGSTTACEYLDQGETWPARLEELLGPQAWVGSAARSGLTSRAHVLQLEHLAPQVADLDLVLCLVGINDLALALEQGAAHDPRGLAQPPIRAAVERAAFFERPRRFALWPPRRTALFAVVDRARRARWARAGAREDRGGHRYRLRRGARRAARAWREELPDLTGALAEYRANLRRMIASARRQGVALVLLTQPVLWSDPMPAQLEELCWFGWIGRAPLDGPEGYYSIGALRAGIEAYNSALLAVGRQEGVACIDLADLPRDTTVFYDDCHFNEAGARLVAQRIATWLAQHRILGGPDAVKPPRRPAWRRPP